MYLPMGAMAIGMVAVVAGGSASAILYVGSGAMAVGMVGMMAGQVIRGKGDRKLKLNGQRRDYLRYLCQVRRQGPAGGRRAAGGPASTPGPRRGRCRRWCAAGQRCGSAPRPTPTSAAVRIATGTQALAVRLVPPETKPARGSRPAVRRRAAPVHPGPRQRARAAGRGVAALVHAASAPTGDAGAARGLVRALIAQVAVTHSPADVRISVCASPGPDAATGSGSSGCRTTCTPPSPTRPGRSG